MRLLLKGTALFKKTANFEILGFNHSGNWSKSASKKVASNYMDNSSSVYLEDVLDMVSDHYKISRNSSNYLLIPARAVSADRPNENLDGWEYGELVRFDNDLGRRVYKSFETRPHFVNHQASRPELSRGVIVDASLNELNEAGPGVKEAVFNATGMEPEKDIFVECLIAMDMSKDPTLANAYKSGEVDKFSMGCDVAGTKCSYCGNYAETLHGFCDHIRNKMSRRAYKLASGAYHIPYEQCVGTRFTELSVVDLPADRSAMIQDGILEVSPKSLVASFDGLSKDEISEISSYIIKNAKQMPSGLTKILDEFLRSI